MKKMLLWVLVLLLAGSSFAFAETDTETANAVAIDTVWILLTAVLVFFMQAGFAMVETGFTRAKNAVNIAMKNLMDFSVGTLAFWAVGFGLMFGADRFGLFGGSGFFLSGANPATAEGLRTFAFWMFQVVFAATAATIVSGAMAERTRFVAYLIYSFVISLFIYPISGHWIWGGGWLGNLGFVDFAGSTVVHSLGGWCALVGAVLLGPRVGKYVRCNGQISVKAIQGHNLPLATLGVLILWFGWFGFNAGSTVAGTDLSIAFIAVNTNLAAVAGAIGAMFLSWIRSKKPDISMSLNGALAGLVGITAGCADVSPGSAILIGLIAGVIVELSVELIDKVLHVDDPVGAVSVHGVCGAWGTLAVGLFAQPEYGGLAGLFFGGGLKQLGVQALGVVSVFGWTVAASLVLFGLLKVTIGLRVSPEEELRGLDIGEHGSEAYAGFQIFTTQ
jgi:Amt family ammonium transporter